MFKLRELYVTVTVLSCFLTAYGADKYTDENRPYEFGFNIDGEQHRHEKKDENGLIMGEFGFITADGVYHVTVYATDENGNFKILSMKNIRTRPYPTAPVREGNSLPFSRSNAAPHNAGPVAQKPISLEPPAKSCSHCSIPTTAKVPALTDLAVVSGNPVSQYPQNYPQQIYPQQNDPEQNYPQQDKQQNDPQSNYPHQNNPQGNPQQNYPQENYPQQNYPHESYPQQNYPQQNYPQQNYPQDNYSQENYPNQSDLSGQDNAEQDTAGLNNAGQGGVSPQYLDQNLRPGDREPKQFNNFLPQGSVPSKPTLISAQMQIVDKNTDIYERGPGEKEGLPNGLSTNDMYDLLYTFNYTVGFHGHHEEGYRNGAKKGYYYITGRNGIRTRVDYEADENGFRPKITEEVLDVLSDDVPKPETEKDDKYGLKGFEFKWLYYPTDSKKR